MAQPSTLFEAQCGFVRRVRAPVPCGQGLNAAILESVELLLSSVAGQAAILGQHGIPPKQVEDIMRVAWKQLSDDLQAGAGAAVTIAPQMRCNKGADVGATAQLAEKVTANAPGSIECLSARIAVAAGVDYHLIVRRGYTDAIPVRPMGEALGGGKSDLEDVHPAQLGLCLRCTATEQEPNRCDSVCTRSVSVFTTQGVCTLEYVERINAWLYPIGLKLVYTFVYTWGLCRRLVSSTVRDGRPAASSIFAQRRHAASTTGRGACPRGHDADLGWRRCVGAIVARTTGGG